MSSVSAIAASGLRAAEQRLEVSARNVASASAGLPGDAPDEVVKAFTALRADQVETRGGGTALNVRALPGRTGSEVDLVEEAVQQLTARYAFVANAKVLQADARMRKSLLDMKI
jgi:flagellar basal-body rod protein FlgC